MKSGLKDYSKDKSVQVEIRTPEQVQKLITENSED